VQPRTKLDLRPGTSLPVDTAIKAVVVLSANDVAVTIAEAIGGTEGHFAELMTAKARALGMTHTYYDNASGLPDPCRSLRRAIWLFWRDTSLTIFPNILHYFSTYSFGYRGATYFTHDNLIGRYDAADGIKTGYTGRSGFNLVSSVVRHGVHIIGVVMGGVTARRRDSEMVGCSTTHLRPLREPAARGARDDPVDGNGQQCGDQAGICRIHARKRGQFAAADDAPGPPGQPSLLPGRSAASADDEDAAESRPDAAYER